MSRTVLKEYTKPIVHMRQQFQHGKFGLVFGSGISKPFRLPHWYDLIQRIAENPEVGGAEILTYKIGSSQASVTQMLFEHYRSKEIDILTSQGKKITAETEKLIVHVWRNIIHEELWHDFQDGYLVKDYHPYIESYINIIKRSNLTINYNFDNILQLLINARRTDEEIEEGKKLYETVYDARLQFDLNAGVIYHPNGFLPYKLFDGASPNLVFSEESFADQLIATMSGHYSTLLHHLSKNTCLFIGLSLDDSTLKHLLHQTAIINPGHYHYYVAYTKDKKKLKTSQRKSIEQSNFDTYNLVTLFLDDKDIKSLGELIQMTPENFEDECKIESVERKFVYYLTGSVGCGKTTTLSYFRNLTTFSEWPEQRLELLSKPWNKLTLAEQKKVDAWVGKMFYKKNRNLFHIKEGITIIDRTPLDPLTFTPSAEWKKKANFLHESISMGGKFRIVPGQILLLEGNQEVIASRVRIRQKKSEYDSILIKKMYKAFDKAFRPLEGDVIRIDTSDLSIYEVVKRVAKIIHYGNYNEQDLHSVLDKWRK